MKVLSWLFVVGCAAPESLLGTETTTPTLSGIQWVLGWDLSDIELSESGSWSTRTNNGYSVTVHEGWLVSSAISLVPCSLDADTGLADRTAPVQAQPNVDAHAPFSDASMLELNAREVLTPPISVTLPELQFSPNQYCSSYWLVARGGPGTDQEHTSLFVRGEWNKADATGQFEIDTNFARASLNPLASIDSANSRPSGRLSRPLSSAFDDIEFTEDNEYAVAWQVILNLTEHASISLQ